MPYYRDSFRYGINRVVESDIFGKIGSFFFNIRKKNYEFLLSSPTDRRISRPTINDYFNPRRCGARNQHPDKNEIIEILTRDESVTFFDGGGKYLSELIVCATGRREAVATARSAVFTLHFELSEGYGVNLGIQFEGLFPTNRGKLTSLDDSIAAALNRGRGW